MKDVAERAGVSIKTVSRVLNNEPHVQDKLQRRVHEAVAALSYVPSQSARSLRGSRSYVINLICHHRNSTYLNALQFGAVIACQEMGYQLSITLLEGLDSQSVSQIRTEFKRMMQRHRPDGLMLVPPYSEDDKLASVLDEIEVPVVRIGALNTKTRNVLVGMDDFKAALELTEHLIALGHKRIGFIRGRENQLSTHERFLGFSNALEAAGLSVDTALVQPGEFDFQSGYIAGQHFLDLDERPTAIFSSNDDMAAGLAAAFAERGLRVPDDLSLVGFDDADIATRMRPFLTTVRHPLQELGATAAHELISVVSKRSKAEPRTIVLDHELIIRDTTATLKS